MVTAQEQIKQAKSNVERQRSQLTSRLPRSQQERLQLQRGLQTISEREREIQQADTRLQSELKRIAHQHQQVQAQNQQINLINQALSNLDKHGATRIDHSQLTSESRRILSQAIQEREERELSAVNRSIAQLESNLGMSLSGEARSELLRTGSIEIRGLQNQSPLLSAQPQVVQQNFTPAPTSTFIQDPTLKFVAEEFEKRPEFLEKKSQLEDRLNIISNRALREIDRRVQPRVLQNNLFVREGVGFARGLLSSPFLAQQFVTSSVLSPIRTGVSINQDLTASNIRTAFRTSPGEFIGSVAGMVVVPTITAKTLSLAKPTLQRFAQSEAQLLKSTKGQTAVSTLKRKKKKKEKKMGELDDEDLNNIVTNIQNEAVRGDLSTPREIYRQALKTGDSRAIADAEKFLKATLGERTARQIIRDLKQQEVIPTTLQRSDIIIPKQESRTTIIPSSEFEGTGQFERTDETTNPALAQKENILVSTSVFQAPSTQTSQRSGLNLLSGMASALGQAQNQKSQQEEKQNQRNRTLQFQLSSQATQQAQQERQIQRNQQRLKQIQRGRTTRIPRPRIPRIPRTGDTLIEVAKQVQQEEGDYDIFVRRKGKDVLSGSSDSPQSALSELKQILSSDLSASGFVSKSGEKVKYDVLGSKFRPSKKDPARIVEKRSFRLDSPSEVKEINLFKNLKKKSKLL